MRQTTLTCSERVIPISIYTTPETLGQSLAQDLLLRIADANTARRPFLLGCPGGRSLRTTYSALGQQARQSGADLSHLVIVMMDEYVFLAETGFAYGPEDAHYSCRQFARREIWAVLNDGLPAGRQIPLQNIWFPDPADPAAYDVRLEAAGGIDFFLLASGASDGHVAFNAPGSRLDESTHVVTLAETTRRDNMATFPQFSQLDDVPTHGVSVGLGTIARLSRQAALVIHGLHKQFAVRRLAGCTDFRADWPASVILRCHQAQILLDEAASADLIPGKVLFLCTGNYYRSRFAEMLFNALAAEVGLNWKADSRGLAADEVGNIGPISAYAIRGLADRGIDVGQAIRFPRQLQAQDLAEADWIVALNEVEHRLWLEQQFPDRSDQVTYWHVYDLHQAPASEALAEIERRVKALIQRLGDHL